MITNEYALIDHAVRRMRQEGVEVTPGNVEAVLNAARGADSMHGRVVTSVCLAPKRPDGTGGEVITRSRTGPKAQAQHAAVVPYFKLSDAKRAEYEASAAGLRAQLASPGLDPILRVRLQQDLAKLQHLLGMDASPTPDQRPLQELRARA